MKELVFFLEEPSAEAMLKGLLPRLLPENIRPLYIVFSGKKDLIGRLSKKLSGWRKLDSAFVILLDQDQESCKNLKKKLLKICRSAADSKQLIVRIACHELESWYFGDLDALGRAINLPNLSHYKNKSKYRAPDRIQKPAKELENITKGAYQKISGSRSVGPELSLEQNSSHSFKIFVKGIKKLVRAKRQICRS